MAAPCAGASPGPARGRLRRPTQEHGPAGLQQSDRRQPRRCQRLGVNPDSDTVGRIDTASGSLIDEIPVGDNPRTLTLTHHPGLRRVYVANQGSDSISRINIASGKAKDLDLPHGSAPYGVALTPDSETLLVTLERTHQLAFVDPRTLMVEDVIPGRVAVVCCRNSAMVIHRPSRSAPTRSPTSCVSLA